MGRFPQQKCQQCALLTAQAAQELHGPAGDGCWNPKVCHRRRSHYRHYDQNKQRRKRASGWRSILPEFVGQTPFEPKDFTAFLYVYCHQVKTGKGLHAVGASVWREQEVIAKYLPKHCFDLTNEELRIDVSRMLKTFDEMFSVTQFDHLIELDAAQCPIQPCPLHPERFFNGVEKFSEPQRLSESIRLHSMHEGFSALDGEP